MCKLFRTAIIATSLIVVALLLAGCASTNTPEAIARSIFGTQEGGERSGITALKYDKGTAVVDYRFVPTNSKGYLRELGQDLTPKLRKLFTYGKTFKKVTVIAYAPFKSKGGVKWEPMLAMDCGPQTIKKLESDGLSDADLVRAADNVTYLKGFYSAPSEDNR